MGPELGELFTLLSDELTWLFWRWDQYVKLYGERPSRLEILNASAPFFFALIQDTLWYETLLGIARIAGPEATGGKQNLSVRRIPPLINDRDLREKVEQLLGTALNACEFAIDWRNRHIAHRDLELSLGRAARPLPVASRERVNNALDSIAAVLNRLESHYFNSTVAYRSSPMTGDAEALLYVLRDGLRRAEERERRLQAGDYRPEDWDDDAPPL
jgi:hypothetical protein